MTAINKTKTVFRVQCILYFIYFVQKLRGLRRVKLFFII